MKEVCKTCAKDRALKVAAQTDAGDERPRQLSRWRGVVVTANQVCPLLALSAISLYRRPDMVPVHSQGPLYPLTCLCLLPPAATSLLEEGAKRRAPSGVSYLHHVGEAEWAGTATSPNSPACSHCVPPRGVALLCFGIGSHAIKATRKGHTGHAPLS